MVIILLLIVILAILLTINSVVLGLMGWYYGQFKFTDFLLLGLVTFLWWIIFHINLLKFLFLLL